ncbi:c-type cytochrome domain-containing protein [Humisphaera borealis]|uniref:Cytochrome c domain-containing protein n=1 Tax=Humisphaera borealis TaxID=2807512 RepID=A0A7M2WTC2_9BACT|nr:c-type cytochrome domain-containing protein [Humisphaera borealis]QOV88061.1 hypothetical protein IPV69_17565 [Humisphaera borealis]
MKINHLLPSGFALLLSGILAPGAQAQEKVTFQDHVLPIFRNACNNCHDPEKKKAGLDLTTYSAMMVGSDNGSMVVAGDPAGSMLFKVVTHAAEPTMPPKRDKLAPKELDLIKAWIAGGLLDTKDGKPAVSNKPKVDLSTVAAAGKPNGPSAIPTGLPAEPVVRTSRAGAVESLASSPWAPVIAVGGQKQIILYHSKSLEILGVLPFEEGVPNVLKFSPNGNLLLAAGGVGAKLGKVVLYDVATGKRLTDVGDELDEVLAADITPDQKLVVLGGPNRLVKAYAVADGAEQYVVKKHTDWVTSIAVSPNGEYLASGDRAGNLYVWEAKTGGELYSLTGHKESITSLVFRDDSTVLMSGSGDGSIKLWNMTDGANLKTFNGHNGGVMSANFAHDGKIVSAGRDRKVRTYDSTGGSAKEFAPAFNDIALHATFDSEGQRIFAGDWTGIVRVWNVADGVAAGELSPNPPRIADRLSEAAKKLVEVEPVIAKAESELKVAQAAATQAADEHKKQLAAVDKAKADIEAAKSALADAERQMTEAVGKADKPVRDLIDLRNNVQQKANQVASAEQGVRESEQAVRAATDLKSLEAAVAQAQAQVDERTKQIRDSEAALKANANDAAAKATLAEARVSVTRRTERLTEAKKALAAGQVKAKAAKPDPAVIKKLEQAKAELNKAKADLAQAEKADGKAAAEADKLAAGRVKAGDTLAKLRTDLSAAEAQVQAKADAAKAAADKVEPAKKTVADATVGWNAARFGVAKLKAQQGATTLHEARKQLTAAEKAKTDAEQAAKDAAALIETGKANLAAFQKARAESPAKVQKLTATIPELRKKVTEVTAPFEVATRDLAEREALAIETADIVRRIGSLAQTSKENKNLVDAEGAGKKVVEQLAAEINAAKEKVNRWTEAKNKAAAELATAEKELAAERSATATAERDQAALKKAIADAQADLPKKEAAAKEAVKPIETAKAKVDQAKADYEKLLSEADKLDPAKTAQAKNG